MASKLLGALAAGAAGYLQGKQMQEDREDMREYRRRRGELMDAQTAALKRGATTDGTDPVTGLTPAVPYEGPASPRAIAGEPQPSLLAGDTELRYADGGMIGESHRPGTPPDPRCTWQARNFKKVR